MKIKRLIAILITLCMIFGLCSVVFAVPAAESAGETIEAAESAEGDSADAESAEGESPEGENAQGDSPEGESTEGGSEGESEGESADLEALTDSLGGSADTAQGGAATSMPPDNSTKPMNILGTRAAICLEYTEDGYVLSQNITDAYTIQGGDVEIPVIGTEHVISGLYLQCDRVDWDADNEVGNSGIIYNALDDLETTFVIGGQDEVYTAPNGEEYNSVVVMYVDPEEPYDNSAQETAPGVGIGINGKRLTLNNVYVESNGYNRPSVYVPTYNNDWNNVKQLPELVCEDSYFINHSTRCLLLMGDAVWFLNSEAITDNWGALSYDFTQAALYSVNSFIQNTAGGYAIYDAAQCDAHMYGSKIVSAGIGIMVARNATLNTDVLSAADEVATEPYNGTADLMTPAATEDGRTVLVGYGNPVKIHADMSGADTVAEVYLKDTYVSSMPEDVILYDGSEFDPANGGSGGGSRGSSGISSAYNDYTQGAAVGISCHNGSVTFDNCEVKSRTGVLVQSFYSHDTMASGIFPVDGAEYAGDSVTIKNMKAEGDILHDDWMRKMVVSLENAELTGKVVGRTLTGWNNYWRAQMAELGAAEEDEATVIRDEVYETLWGVRMVVDSASVWNVTETSQLYSLFTEEGAVIQPAAGKTMTIYVDCPMGNDLENYDISAGTQIDAFELGREYSGVVIVVE